jgi:DNA modification methylase
MLEGGVYLADNLTILPGMPAESVDIVLTDPPFGQLNEHYEMGEHGRFGPAKWPNHEVWRQCYRIAKPEACLVSFAGNPTYHRLATDIENAGWKVRQMWAWVHKDGMITSSQPKDGFDKLAPAFTPICFAVKGSPVLALEREGAGWERKGRKGAELSERSRPDRILKAGGHWPRNIVCTDGVEGFQFFGLPFAKIPPRAGADRHPNEKPVPILIWLLGKLPGQVVLDPYAGGGSTGAAAVALGKVFIGVEKSAGYFGLMRQRLQMAASGDYS